MIVRWARPYWTELQHKDEEKPLFLFIQLWSEYNENNWSNRFRKEMDEWKHFQRSVSKMIWDQEKKKFMKLIGNILYVQPREECAMHDSYIQISEGQSCRIEGRSAPEDKTLNSGLKLQGNSLFLGIRNNCQIVRLFNIRTILMKCGLLFAKILDQKLVAICLGYHN